MSDILRHLAIDVSCEQCGDFTIGADVVAESQQLLARGCPGSPHECPATVYAELVGAPALASLERVWGAVDHPVEASHRNDGFLRVVVRPDAILDARALAVWEDDGGRAAPANPGGPSLPGLSHDVRARADRDFVLTQGR